MKRLRVKVADISLITLINSLFGAAIAFTPPGTIADSRSQHISQNRLRGLGLRELSCATDASATDNELRSANRPSPEPTKAPDTTSFQLSSSDSGSSTASSKPSPEENVVEVVLTFDDGPHVEPLGRRKNHTEHILNTLKNNLVQSNTKAAFFVQTHAPGRGGTPIGRNVISILAREGHVIGIHTGSTKDHASHCARVLARPYDADGSGVFDRADGLNGLESDMVRAKTRIRKLTVNDPLYVRPTYGERNRQVRAAYGRQRLRMILWDIDSGDNTGSPDVDVVNQAIRKGMQRCIAAGTKQIVILFHDINLQTAANLEEYLANICIAARALGKTAVFPTSAERIIEILNGKRYQ